MSVSVIVSNFNGARWLPRLLETLEAQQGVTLEIIVVDRHSADDSMKILALHPQIKILHEPADSGLVAGYHRGVSAAQYEHLFFCNEDMWFGADCLTRLEREIDLTHKIACADPWQWTYDGSNLIHAAPQIRRQWNRGSPHPWYPFEENKSLPCGHVVACACASSVMIHRFAYDDIGGWDTSFFLDQEDTDLAIRLWQRGWLTVTVPEAKVFHAVGASNTKIIPGLNLMVAQKRYIHALSNQSIVVWKLFSPRFWFMPLLPWLETFLKDLFKSRFRRAGWDLLALKTSLSRLPQVFRFRRSSRVMNRHRPGELFFNDRSLQFGALIQPTRNKSEAETAVRLSVALVTRNRPEWLRQCLQSWRSQDQQPFEIIVSDDSDDSIRLEIQRLCDQFHCRWIPGPRRGLYANRNNAFRATGGTHVMSADDDHTHPSGFVGSVVGAVRSDPQAIWTFGEQPADRANISLPMPGELRSNGTVGPPEDPTCSAAIACGSSVYPAKIFQLGFRCSESYRFGGLWYLWGHQLRRAGFRIRHNTETFVWHHTASSNDRRSDRSWIEAQHECNLYVQAAHAMWISHKPVALIRAVRRAIKLLTVGESISSDHEKVRLRTRFILRAFTRALRPESL